MAVTLPHISDLAGETERALEDRGEHASGPLPPSLISAVFRFLLRDQHAAGVELPVLRPNVIYRRPPDKAAPGLG